jgi:hypothetical protein
MAFNDRMVLVKFVRWISGTAVCNISSRYARSVYNLNNKQQDLKSAFFDGFICLLRILTLSFFIYCRCKKFDFEFQNYSYYSM